MRKTIILFLLLPIISAAQVNRSAREYATEKIEEYIHEKLFQQLPYKPISFGELKTYDDRRKEIHWLISHQFEIIEPKIIDGKKDSRAQTYNFYFYLDDKMRVKKAETYFVAGK